MTHTLRSYSLVLMGIVCGLIWGGACSSDDDDAVAAPQTTTPGAVLVGSEPNATASSDQFVMLGNVLPEDRATIIAPRAGTITNLFMRPNQAPAASAVVVGTLRVNGVDTALTVTHTSANGTSAVSDTTDQIAIAQGDRIVFRLQETAGFNANANYTLTAEFR